jgi:kynurenine formamidase
MIANFDMKQEDASMAKVIDLTQEIYQDMPVFPGHLKTIIWDHASHEETAKIMGEEYSYNTKGLLLCDHGPTHVDAVCHIDPRPEAPGIDKMPLETFYGPAMCLDVSHVPENSLMGPDVVQEAERKAGLEIQPGDIVLFYTAHYDRYYPKPEYLEGYAGFSVEAAEYLIEEKKIKNWGVDNPSTDRPPTTTYPVHMHYRKTGVPHMEHLCNLDKVAGKRFTFFGLPLKIRGGTGSPIRAIAILD